MNALSLLRLLRRRLPFSREGLGWLALSIAILTTGLIKGINLITLLACVFLGVVIVNLVLARRQVAGLIVDRDAPEFLLAGTANAWSVRIRQRRPRARYGLCLGESWSGELAAWFVDLPAETDATRTRQIEPAGRGVVALGPMVIRSGFPFGLAAFERTAAAAATIYIAPRLGQLQRGVLCRWLSRRHPSVGAVRSRPIRHPAGQMEFHGLRTFRAGDSPRLVHWRTTARRGELMVREFEEYPNDDLVVIVDLTSANDPALFERMLSLAATIVWEWCRQKGDRLTVVLAGAAPRRFSGPTGTILRAEVLRALAGAQPISRSDGDAVIAALQESPESATAHLLLSVGPSVLIDPLEATLRHVLAVVDVAARDEVEFFEL